MKTLKSILPSTFMIIALLSVPTSISAKDKAHKPITEKLILLLKSKPELKSMLENSIEKAKKINPDKKTNPVQSIDEYYAFIDKASELIPRQIINDPPSLTRDQILQSICYFYFLIDQPLDELKDKKQFKNSLQFYEEFSPWLIEFADTWGKFLDTEESWSKDQYLEFKTDPSYGLRKDWYESSLNWRTFNQFFSRKLKNISIRPIEDINDPSVVTSPVDSVPQGVWEISEDSKIEVKNGMKVKLATYYSIQDLLSEDSAYKNAFKEGVLTHTFLNVNDYHRFHFPVSGKIIEKKIISKNVALEVMWNSQSGEYTPEDSTGWQFTQTRGYVIVDTVNYGLVVLMPMGMAQVSSVNFEKNITEGSNHKKGSPLGYFLFGGSDFIMIFQNVANFKLTAPTEASNKYKHIQVGRKYGSLEEDKNHSKQVKIIQELDKIASLLKLPPLSGVNPYITKSEVDFIIYKEVRRSGRLVFDKDRFTAEAAAKYNLWKVGEKVSFKDLQGSRHEGEVKEINSKYIKIGTKRIFTIDFTEKMLPHLRQDRRKKAMDKYISEKKKIYFAKKRTQREALQAKVQEKHYTKYGFVTIEHEDMDYKTYKSYLLKKLPQVNKKLEEIQARKEAIELKNKNKQ